MQPIFSDTTQIEKEAKLRYNFPDFIMMENAATALENLIISIETNNSINSILILCGKGNNGGDGYALARKLYSRYNISILKYGEPTASEAKTQYQMAKAIGINIIESIPETVLPQFDLIVDCIFGTGFHGELPQEISTLFETLNKSKSLKIACDIPSGISKTGTASKNTFKADYTVTMGALKYSLFTDAAKDLTGKIIIANLGIQQEVFEACSTESPIAKLIQKSDIALPLRKELSGHKGTYGHTVVFAGEKSGAAILSASAAMHFGSGLTSLLVTGKSNLNQFKISPELMICNEIPQKTSCIVIGNGLGSNDNSSVELFLNWAKNSKSPKCVIDADIFAYPNLQQIIEELNSIPNIQIVMTPHPKEFQNLLNALKINSKADYSISDAVNNRIELGKAICQKYKSLTLVLKSASTIIVSEQNCYLCTSGSPALAKGGSGDVLAGLIGALLSQNYNSEMACITACFSHGEASLTCKNNYALTPEQLIENLSILK